MKLTEFRPEHLLEMEMMVTPDGVTNERHQAIIKRGLDRMGPNAFTARHENEIIGCGGVRTLWPGVGEGWLVPSVRIVDFRSRIVRLCREAIQIIWENEPDLNRIQALIINGFTAGDNFATYLGFQFEGLLRKYGRHGEDYKMFALLRS